MTELVAPCLKPKSYTFLTSYYLAKTPHPSFASDAVSKLMSARNVSRHFLTLTSFSMMAVIWQAAISLSPVEEWLMLVLGRLGSDKTQTNIGSADWEMQLRIKPFEMTITPGICIIVVPPKSPKKALVSSSSRVCFARDYFCRMAQSLAGHSDRQCSVGDGPHRWSMS